jgi:hypothetical protein
VVKIQQLILILKNWNQKKEMTVQTTFQIAQTLHGTKYIVHLKMNLLLGKWELIYSDRKFRQYFWGCGALYMCTPDCEYGKRTEPVPQVNYGKRNSSATSPK